MHTLARCAKCGTTELLEEHHISYDPEITEYLCLKHHAEKHPDKANLILSNRIRQWRIPVSIIAKQAGVSKNTIRYRATKLGVNPRALSSNDIKLIIASGAITIPKQTRSALKQLSIQVGVTETAIRARARRLGIDLYDNPLSPEQTVLLGEPTISDKARAQWRNKIERYNEACATWR